MVETIRRDQLRHLMSQEEAQVIDVLPEGEYSESHIPGAANIPLRTLTAETVSSLRRDKPVVVY